MTDKTYKFIIVIIIAITITTIIVIVIVVLVLFCVCFVFGMVSINNACRCEDLVKKTFKLSTLK